MKLWQKECFITLNFENLCLTVFPLSSGMYVDLENIVYVDFLIQGTYISTTHGCIKHTFFEVKIKMSLGNIIFIQKVKSSYKSQCTLGNDNTISEKKICLHISVHRVFLYTLKNGCTSQETCVLISVDIYHIRY